MSFTVVSGVKTQYQHIGKTGPLLVLLHGWGHDWQTWSPLIPTLSEKYQLLLVDLPAFGQSEAPAEPWSSKRYAEWLGSFLSVVGPHKPMVVIGHSFGGKVAAMWAATQPAMLRGLVLCDASGLPDPLTLKQQLIQTVVSLVPAGIKRLASLGVRRRLLEGAGAATDHLNSTPAQRSILKVIVREYIAEFLLKITVPTLLLWGENDQDTPPSQGKKFAQLIPNSQFHLIPEAGHFIFHDQPQIVLSHLQSFFKSVTIE